MQLMLLLCEIQYQRSPFTYDVDDVASLSLHCIRIDAARQRTLGGGIGVIFNIFTAKLQGSHYNSISWVESYPPAGISLMKRKDPDIGIVISWLKNKEKPTKSQLYLKIPAAWVI